MVNKEIDIVELLKKVWYQRKFIFKIIIVGGIIGIIVALSIPRQYTVKMTLSPESGKGSSGNGIIGVASMLGIGSINSSEESDALNVYLFPDIVSSTPFLLELFDVKVQSRRDGVVTYPLYDYINTQKHPWWSMITKIPSSVKKALDKLLGKNITNDNNKVNPFELTEDQDEKLEILRKSITANVNKKTGITTVNVTFQDPLVAATLADTVINKLQEYITKYRVSKAKDDYVYLNKLYIERRNDYYKAQSAYADYIDANKNVILQKVLSEKDRLQNETNLSYQVYSQVATQLQMARAKIQEAKPIFAVVEPATIPLKPSGTSSIVILFVFLFSSLIIGICWVLFADKLKYIIRCILK